MPFRILLLGALFLPASVAADAGGEALPCEDDADLARAAAELLLSASPLTTSTLTAAVREAGSDAVGVHALSYQDTARVLAWLKKLEGGADGPLACGVAHTAKGHLAITTARGGRLAPIDPQAAIVRGTLADGFERAELIVADGRGEVQRFAVDAAQLRVGVALAQALERPLRVQLLAHGRQGPRPVAERVVGPTRGAPSKSARTTTTVPTGRRAPAVETTLDRALDELRVRAGRPRLRSNTLLASAAEEHAEHVCASGRVAHELEPGQDPKHRLRAAGITARRVGETVARADSTEAALRSFMASPSHRLTLLERGFTDAGVGLAEDARGKRCVVVLLAEWPRFSGR